ncbi:hypothetical protein V6N13_084904 [Hibiscus sabdariffa]
MGENLDLLVEDIKSKLEFAKSSNQAAAQDCIIRSVDPLLGQVNDTAYRPAENNRYSETFRDLNAYNAVRYHGWIAKLRLLYFKSLWTSVGTVVAILLLLLTLTQTIRSIIAL